MSMALPGRVASDTLRCAMAERVAPYGTWASPITAEAIARGSVTLSEPEVAANAVWWIEGRPLEGGRQVVVRAELDGSERRDVFGEGVSARTRVHEYGGGAFAVVDGDVVFSNDSDGCVHRVTPGADPVALTPEPKTRRALRYADFCSDYCVRESHQGGGEVINDLVAVADGDVHVIARGHDFYAAPRPSPDGKRLAWISWDHPRMPWDGTELWVANADGSAAELVAGGPDESILQPNWSPDGRLHWISDRSGWWNLYREREALYPADAEFAMPMWVFGQSMYAFLDDGRIACAWSSDAFPHLGLLDPDSRAMEALEPERLPKLRSARIRTDGRRLVYVGASPTLDSAIVVLDTQSGGASVVAEASEDEPDPRYVSEPRPIEF